MPLPGLKTGTFPQRLLDFLLPPHCILCGFACGSGCLCMDCKSGLPWLEVCCRRCASPLASSIDKSCGVCLKSAPLFQRTIAPLRYEFPADRLVQALKFKRQLVAGRVLARLIWDCISAKDERLPDLLVPVPLHGMRMMKRGFNQAVEIALHLGRHSGIEVSGAQLRRRRNTPAQSGLNQGERRKNVRGAFRWHGLQRAPRHVALVDDVMTTGTTVTECAKILKNAGAVQVDIWVAARAISR